MQFKLRQMFAVIFVISVILFLIRRPILAIGPELSWGPFAEGYLVPFIPWFWLFNAEDLIGSNNYGADPAELLGFIFGFVSSILLLIFVVVGVCYLTAVMWGEDEKSTLLPQDTDSTESLSGE